MKQFSPLGVIFLTIFTLFYSEEGSAKRYYITRWGACSDCETHGYSYRWCSLGSRFHDWDYCSKEPGYTTRGTKCSNDCDFHGYSYRWCYVEGGGWDYCSLIEDHSVTYYTYQGKECQNYCEMDNGESVYKCRTSDGYSGRCSLVEDVTYNGNPCLGFLGQGGDENHCAVHGQRYLWCWTTYGWDYCSNPLSTIVKRRLNEENDKYCPCPTTTIQSTTQCKRNKQKLITYVGYQSPNPNRVQQNISERNRDDAIKLIHSWDAQSGSEAPYFLPGIASHIFGQRQEGTIRMDRQGSFSRNGVRFVNIQLQINGRDAPRTSTVAHANIEIGVVGRGWDGLQDMDINAFRRHVVTALSTSLRNRATAWVYQELLDSNGKPIPR